MTTAGTAKSRFFTTVTAAGLLAATTLACRAPDVVAPPDLAVTEIKLERDLVELNGRLLSRRELLIVPTRDWHRDPDTGLWSMNGAGQVVCHVLSPLGARVVFRLTPEDPAAASRLELDWDGSAAAGTIIGGETLEVIIPPENVAPGTHILTVRTPPSAAAGPTLFEGLGFRFRGKDHEIPVAGHLRFQYLADLLTLGVTGSKGSEKAGGFVLDGPQAVALTLNEPTAGVLTTRVQNSSGEPAVFRVAHARASVEQRVEPHERANLRLELPAGTDRLVLSTEGPAGGLFLWGEPHLHRPDGPPRPPVVLITLDTTRRDAVGAFGGPDGVTPNLDTLAQEATVFTSACAPSPWTLASHASLFTSRYPSGHGAGVRSTRLGMSLPTLAGQLREHGYVTSGYAGGVLCSFRFGLARGFDIYHDPDGFERAADSQTELALAFLESHAAHPFLLFVNYFDPHFPYQAPQDLQRTQGVPGRLEAIRGQTPWPQIVRGNGGAFARAVEGEHPASDEALVALRAAYLAEVAFVDQQLGRVLNDLRNRGLYDDALIVVAADHGELLGERGYFSHSCRLDPELIDIPMLVKWPGQRSGRSIDSPVSLVDLLPTVLAAAEIPAPAGDGLPLSQTNPPTGRDRVLMEEHHAPPIHPLFDHMRIADHLFGERDSRSRRTVWAGGGECLTLEGDVWSEAVCPTPPDETLRRVRLALGRDTEPAPEAAAGLTAQERESLEALGYLH